jgi:hypothetical protein
MASTQHPIRGVGPDPKGDSLVAIKKWLIRDPRSAQPEPYLELSYSSTAGDRPANQRGLDDAPRIAEAPASDRTVNQKELDDAPSIAEASEPSIDLITDEHVNASVTKEFVGCRVMQGDEVQEGKSAIRKVLLRTSVCLVLLLAAIAFCTFEGLPYLEQRGVFSNQDAETVSQRSRIAAQSMSPSATSGDAQSASVSDKSSFWTLQHQLDTMSEDLTLAQRAARNAWDRFRNWSSDELNAVLQKKDVGAVAERSETTARSAQPAPAIDRPLSSESQNQFDTMWEDLGFVQRAANNTWTRLRDWSSHQLQAVLPGNDMGTSSERSAAVARGVTPSAGVMPTPGVTPSAISDDVKSPIRAQPPSPVDRSSSSELQHELDAMTENLGILQRMVADLTDRQEQITKDIADLQTAQQNVSQKLSALPRSWVGGTSRKSLRHRAY